MDCVTLDKVLMTKSYAEICAFFQAMEQNPDGLEMEVYRRSAPYVQQYVDSLKQQFDPDKYTTWSMMCRDENGNTLQDYEIEIRSSAQNNSFRTTLYPAVRLLPGKHKIESERKSLAVFLERVLNASGRPWKFLSQQTVETRRTTRYIIEYEIKADERDMPTYLMQVADLKNHRIQPLLSYHDPDTEKLMRGFIDDPESEWQRHSYPGFDQHPYQSK